MDLQSKYARVRSYVACGAVALLVGLTTVFAQSTPLPPAVQTGVAWLSAQVQGDGSLANENGSIATSLQNREESLVTLSTLASAPTALATSVSTATADNTEYLARQILAASSLHQSAKDDVTALLAAQNSDGGWGLYAGYQSDALDTALALQALQSANASSSNIAGALNYLAQAKQADGSWGINSQSSIYVTANVLLAVSAWSNTVPDNTGISTAATTWLLAARNANQEYGDPFDNAYGLLALSTQPGQSSALQSLTTALNGAQLADGSWGDDPYVTALASRAIWQASQPPPSPPTGGVKGAVVDLSTGQSVVGATVDLVENTAASTSSGANGAFNLSALTAGGYTLRITKVGYQVSTTSIQVPAGQVLNVGTIAIVPAPTTANLTGVIKDSSGSPLANVIVSVGTSTTSTDANGAYRITGLSPGSTKITATLSGYQTAAATVNFVAGYSYTFSPTLYTNAQTPPGTSVQGIVIDGVTSSPIPGAAVTFNGTTQTTDANGKFIFASAAAGGFTIQISATGYLTVTATGTLAGGVNDLGKIVLSLAPSTARLSGVVKNSSGGPLAGVTVSVGASTASTDANGAYQLAGIPQGSATITASLAGYQSAIVTANFVAGNNYTFSPTLYSSAQTPPGTSLQGIVINAATNNPISGATVVLNGASQTSDANGKFLFVNLTAGNFTIQVSAAGYFAVNGTGTLAAGVNDVGKVALTPAPQATNYQAINSAGPLNKIFVGADLSAQVAHTGDSSYEVYPPDTIPGDFGTFIVVGSDLYAPHFNSRGTATYDDGGIGNYTPFTLVSQTDVLGSGLSSDPFTVSTVANVGTTGLSIKQTDSYIVGQETFRTDVTVTNATNAPISAVLYRALDCYLGNSDYGYGFAVGGAIGCTKQPNNSPPDRIEEFVPLTSGANYFESYYASVWSAIGTHNPFPNHCDCATNEDNGIGLSWNITVPANGSVTYSNLTVFSPTGNQPVVVTKTVDAASAAPGDSDGYTITVRNLNASPLLLDSITDTLPVGFVYTAGSSTGVTTSDPSISAQVLTWSGPFTIPASGNVTLHFGARVAIAPGTYYNQATAAAGANVVVPTGQTAPVTINAVNIGVTTDKPEYPANATAQISTTLSNLNALAVSGNLTVEIYDASGARVGGVVAQQVNIPASGTLPIAAPFAIGTILPAQYTVNAVFNHNGIDIAKANATFNVLPDNGAASATATLHTDKQTYNPTDQVQIQSRVTSLSSNVVLSNLALNVSVYNASGVQQFTHSYAIAQLLPGATLDFSSVEALSNAPPGMYTVKQDLLDAQGHLFNHVETTYTVSSTADTGFSLVGTIAATPKKLPVGATLTLNASATNKGNADLTDIPLVITIVEPVSGQVLQQFKQISNLAIGVNVPFSTPWVTQGQPLTTYSVVLSAAIGSGPAMRNITLAVDTFVLSAPLVVTKTADASQVAPVDLDGYTINISNANGDALTVDSISDTLPAGFSYTGNSSTGVTTNNPSIAGQTLTWNGPFTVPASGNITLHFGVMVTMSPGTYYNQATSTSNTSTYVVVPTGATAPVTIKAVNIDVVTDKPLYLPNTTAQITTTLNNLNTVPVGGVLTVSVYDESGSLVGGVVSQQQLSIPANGTLPVSVPFAIGTMLPAQYTVKAVLNHNGVNIAQAQTTFKVDNPTATSTVQTDKAIYNPTDQVQLQSRVLSLSANTPLSNLALNVSVYNAGGVQQFTHSYAIAQLLPAATLDLSSVEALSNAPPGVYTVKQDLLDSQGHLFNHVETTYTVSSTADTGFGLVGTIAATPKTLPVGATLTLNASATNQGNADLTGVPLTITIVDAVSGQILQQFSQTSNLARGVNVPFTTPWVTKGQPQTTYSAVLSAAIGSGASMKNLTLAVDTFTLTLTVALKADVTLKAGTPSQSALALIDPTTSNSEIARVTNTLSALGYSTMFVNTPTDFATGVRSGSYQLYLLLGAQITPDATTQRLLREAVHRGEGLISANGVAALPDALAQISGLKASSALPVINAQALDVLTTAPGGAGHTTFTPSLPGHIVVPTSAQPQAIFTGRLPAAPDQGTLSDEVASLGRIDTGYFGTDTALSLTSVGRLHYADGTDHYSVWRIRNGSNTAHNVILASMSGGYSLALTIAPHTDTFIASPIVAGTADHTLSENGTTLQAAPAITTVFTDPRIVDVGDNPGAIALWANAISTVDAFNWTGAQHVVHGAVHSNSDIQLSGAQNLIDGPLHYVTTFSNSGSQNTFTFAPRQVTPQPLPILLQLDDYKPNGPVATAVGASYFDQTAECTSKKSWHRTPKDMPLTAGVYYIPCEVQINGDAPSGNVTLVSTGLIQIDGAKGSFTPFYQGLQFVTTQTGGAIKLSGSNTQVGGLVFAPKGTVTASGDAMAFQCSVIADQIRFAGAKTTIDARTCPYATVQRQAPAVLFNTFGSGIAAYSAFDWQGAIGQYETTPGILSSLFGKTAGVVAPTQNPLRAGTMVPLTTTVQSLNDPFQGALKLAANDDSIYPLSATWPLDFTTQNPIVANSMVRLGTSTSTLITATVSAKTPIVVDPLQQATLTVAHLSGESINDLIAAVNAISGRDAGLNVALAALQAAQTASSANDKETTIQHLLDAAEASGQSTNSQADALRTRVDWVVWGKTH